MAFSNPVFTALPDPGRRQMLRLGGAALAGGMLPGLAAGEAETPVRGGTLVAIAHPEPSTLATHINGANPISLVTSKIYDRLFTEGNDYELLPRLALSVDTSKDGLDWTIRLRKGVRWHDGHPFDSGDVKFSIDKIWPIYHSNVTNVIEKVTAPDAHTIVLRLKQKWPILIRHLGVSAGQILPQHLYEGTDIITNPYNNKPVGTGPFRFKEWQRGSHIVLERNPDYYMPGLPHLDRIVWKVINDSASRAAALETGAAHYAARNPVTFSDAARLRQRPDLVIDTKQYEPNSYWLEFNLRDPVIGKLAVRQAIAHAIDRAALVKTVWGGYGAPLDAPVPSGVAEYFTKDVPKYPFDPKRAEQLLDQAGFPRKAGGWRFKLTHDFIPFGDDYRRTGEYVRQALRRVGIDASLGGKDLSTWTRDVFTNRNFQVISTWGGWTRDPQNSLDIRFGARGDKRGVPWYKVSGYTNKEIDALLEPTRSGADPALRKTNYKRIQQIVQAELPVLPLLEVYFFSVLGKRVRNVDELPYQTRNNFANVWLAKA
ncbi:ABC transporter substrate-binding protein [Massilia dura]|uniref:ABC transporter substrate-binding protein n=1 Tax=Pseudoduganella dura TaxID=321982 RepID=A0A6I3XNN8_9BURK|nr:ABC transporter substrate-binding protein [Pseudoduganella dura]MUI16083.1 ABC transporter substrate-binding protein [Pseudoduganella dura]GGY11910.1 peptide ABC transporter substrate-binding protein [Pseudoduganella dura]